MTRPPSRMRVPGATCFSTTSLGELKNTMESRNALSISATATASTPSPPPIRTRRRCLRVIVVRLRRIMLSSAFETQIFDEIVDALDLVGTIRQRAPGVGWRRPSPCRDRRARHRRAPAAASPRRRRRRHAAGRQAAAPCRGSSRCAASSFMFSAAATSPALGPALLAATGSPLTRASAARTKLTHGASGGASSSSARHLAAAASRLPSCSSARPRK